ncbi:MAG: uracil-DNA glycosylase [Syntrophomonadaceae bacterium]|nr:uracil-DNA glycosylase [Syntrophomonadaceae bacterium]
MTTEQPNLFGDIEEAPRENRWPDEKVEETNTLLNFLPLVKIEDAYPEKDDYEKLWQAGRECHKCRLRSTCQQVVFGAGNMQSKIMLVGEGPGKDEDIQGLPFVGRAGQLLDKILQAAEIPRPEVFITNVVKCRPPGNRLPNPDEVKVCRNWLEAQIRILKPQIIVCLGAMASQTIIDPKAAISKIRGRWFSRQGIKIMATFHPAALLRNESYKKPTWEDFKQIRDEYKR